MARFFVGGRAKRRTKIVQNEQKRETLSMVFFLKLSTNMLEQRIIQTGESESALE